uniref:Uncharacterized protein n=1 Tax=Lepeophtheirus salmonis TaxID=72036 RepID=A0A0K2TNJ8_LEPSM
MRYCQTYTDSPVS